MRLPHLNRTFKLRINLIFQLRSFHINHLHKKIKIQLHLFQVQISLMIHNSNQLINFRFRLLNQLTYILKMTLDLQIIVLIRLKFVHRNHEMIFMVFRLAYFADFHVALVAVKCAGLDVGLTCDFSFA